MSANLQAIRDYASSLQGDDRKSFIDKFNSIKNDESKVSILSDRISSINGDNKSQSRFKLKKDKPYDSYSYGDALGDTAKGIINNFADVGDKTIETAKGLNTLRYEHPLMYPLILGKNAVGGLYNTVTHPKESIQSFMDMIKNTQNKPVDTALTLGSLGMAAEGVPDLMKAIKNAAVSTPVLVKSAQEGISNAADSNIVQSIPRKIRKFKSQRDLSIRPGMDNYSGRSNISIETKMSNRNSDIAFKAKKEIEDINNKTDKAINYINNNNNILEEDLGKSIRNGTIDYQNSLKTVHKNNSEIYGKSRDAIFDKMDKDGVVINRDEINQKLDHFESELLDDGITEGPIFNKIKLFRDKYGIKEDVITSKILGENQKPISEIVKTNGNDPIVLKEFHEDLKRIGLKNRNKKWDRNDFLLSRLDYELSDILKGKSEAFRNLQEGYAPVIKLARKSDEIFKPYKGENYIDTGMNFLRKVSTKAGDPEDIIQNQSIIKQIESGAPGYTGTGNISGKSVNFGNQLESNKNNLSGVKSNRDLLIDKINKIKEERLRKSEVGSYKGRRKIEELLNKRYIGRKFAMDALKIIGGGKLINTGAKIITH